MSDFVHLHIHTQYSILDGASDINKLLEKAKNDGMKALAITDHGNMYGAQIFHATARKKGVKPILGCEVYVARNGRFNKSDKGDRNRDHLILLAKNKTGYHNLIKLVSKGWTEGFYYSPRVDKELLKQYSEGIIASSACLGGEVPQLVMNESYEAAREVVKEFKEIYGDDYYLELQRHKSGIPEIDEDTFQQQQKVNQVLLKLAEEMQVKVIATNDVHFVDAEDAEAHDRLICLNTGKDLDDPTRLRYTKQEYLKTQQEMAGLFADIPDALINTIEIADKVEDYELDHDPIMPEFPIPADFETIEGIRSKHSEDSLREEFGKAYDRLGGYEPVTKIKLESDYLRKLVYDGASKRYGANLSDDVRERIDFELNTIKTMGFPGYFLIVQDFLSAAREMGVAVGPGRGSAAGSVVAYCIRITDIDPIRYDLLFERFLNPDRISMPDIDIDFDDDGRELVLKWVVDKYGKNRVAQIVTYGTMAAKGAIKDVARVQKLPLAESNRLTKLVPERPGITLDQAFQEVKELEQEKQSKNPLIIETLKYAKELEGSVRQVGIHACGIIIGKEDLTNYIPISTSKESELLVTQYDGKHIESVGMLKMDFLGLKTLSIIKDAVENISLSKKIQLDISEISLDDPATYELYSKGETTGLFQFESPGMKKYLKELKPNRFEDLIAMNALYRPGPMEYIPDFIRRKHGQEPIVYDLPEMEEYLKDTYGITVYQEQVMLLARKLGGFTRGEADSLRKAMGKKIESMMNQLKEKFVEGCQKNGHDLKVVEKIWNDWAAFAKYAFNKSHSTCYSYVSYQTAFLKAHYPAEFMAAVLSRNTTDIKKITTFMDECKRMGLRVLLPDVNESRIKFTVNSKGDIRFGLGAIKGVGESAAQEIIKQRELDGPYKDVFDFFGRVNLQQVNKRTIESLILAGALDFQTDIGRHQYFANLPGTEVSFLETLIKYGNKVQSEKNNKQITLFGEIEGYEIPKPEVPVVAEWSSSYQLNKEKELIGIYLSAHPLDEYRIELNHFCSHSLSELHNLEELENMSISFGGKVTASAERMTKNGFPFGTMELEDFTDSYKLSLFQKDYIKFKSFFTEGLSLFIRAKVQKRAYSNSGELELKIDSMELLSELKTKVKELTVQLPLEVISRDFSERLMEWLKLHQGKTNLQFKIVDEEEQISLNMFSRRYRVQVSPEFMRFFEEEDLTDFRLN